MRLIYLLVLVIAATGCTTIQPVSRVDVMEIDELNRELRGRTIGIEFANGMRERGRLEFVRMDSLAWQSGGVRQVVPLHHVDRLVSDNRLRSTRDGLLIGATIGVILTLAALTSSNPWDRLLAPYMIPGTAYHAGLWGVVLGRRRVYQLKDFAPWHSTDNDDSGTTDN